METLTFNGDQVTKILEKVVKEKGFNKVMQYSLEALMRSERKAYLEDHGEDVGNGYRPRKAIGQGRVLELQVPRTRQGNFYPVLLSVLRDQQSELERIATSLYGAGLTTVQVGDVFEEIYGKHYSKQRVSQMLDVAKEEVQGWLARPLEDYYPIIYIDATMVPTRRIESVSKEAYYTVLGVRADRSREVLAVVNHPSESAESWKEVLAGLKRRGVRRIGLVVSDHLSGITDAVAYHYSGARHQLCTVHLKRTLIRQVKPADRKALSEELKAVFRTEGKSYRQREAWAKWQALCARWGKKYPSMAKRGQDSDYMAYFTYLDYHPSVRPMLWTTNWVERLNREYKRTLRMRGALSYPGAVIFLMGRVAMTRAYLERKVPHLGKEEKLFDWA